MINDHWSWSEWMLQVTFRTANRISWSWLLFILKSRNAVQSACATVHNCEYVSQGSVTWTLLTTPTVLQPFYQPLVMLLSVCGPPTSGSGRKFGRFHSKSCRENLTRLYLISAPKLHKLYGNLKFHNPYYIHDKTAEKKNHQTLSIFRQSSTITCRWPVAIHQS